MLLLDEPTNHLDIETIDSLAHAINGGKHCWVVWGTDTTRGSVIWVVLSVHDSPSHGRAKREKPGTAGKGIAGQGGSSDREASDLIVVFWDAGHAVWGSCGNLSVPLCSAAWHATGSHSASFEGLLQTSACDVGYSVESH